MYYTRAHHGSHVIRRKEESWYSMRPLISHGSPGRDLDRHATLMLHKNKKQPNTVPWETDTSSYDTTSTCERAFKPYWCSYKIGRHQFALIAKHNTKLKTRHLLDHITYSFCISACISLRCGLLYTHSRCFHTANTAIAWNTLLTLISLPCSHNTGHSQSTNTAQHHIGQKKIVWRAWNSIVFPRKGIAGPWHRNA